MIGNKVTSDSDTLFEASVANVIFRVDFPKKKSLAMDEVAVKIAVERSVNSILQFCAQRLIEIWVSGSKEHFLDNF